MTHETFFSDNVTHIDIPNNPSMLRYFFPELYPNLKSLHIYGDILNVTPKHKFDSVINTLENVTITLDKTDIYKCIHLAVSIFGSYVKKYVSLDTCFGGKCHIIYTQRSMGETHFQTFNKLVKESMNINNRDIQIKGNVVYIV